MKPKVAFLFPGQGSQRVGMGKDFYESFEFVRNLYDEANEVLGFDIASLSFSGPEESLRLTFNTQPAILIHSYIAYRLLRMQGVEPAVAAGHSLGEYSALLAAGATDFPIALDIVRKRGRFMQDDVPPEAGAMAAIIGLSGDEVEVLCNQVSRGRVVQPANYNAPDQVVVAGEKGAVDDLVEASKGAGARRAITLAVSAPFHCTLLKGAQDKLAQELERIEFRDLTFPVVSNVSARPVTSGPDARENLKPQVTSPVRWEESLRTMLGEGASVMVEVGPGRVLTALAKRIDERVITFNVEDMKSLERTLSGLRELSLIV